VNPGNTNCTSTRKQCPWPVVLTVFLRGVPEGMTFLPMQCSPTVSFYKASLETPGFLPNAKQLSILFPCNPVGIIQQGNRP